MFLKNLSVKFLLLLISMEYYFFFTDLTLKLIGYHKLKQYKAYINDVYISIDFFHLAALIVTYRCN